MMLTNQKSKMSEQELSVYMGLILEEFKNSPLDLIKNAFKWGLANLHGDNKIYRLDFHTTCSVVRSYKEHLRLSKVYKPTKEVPVSRQIQQDHTSQINRGIARAFEDYRESREMHPLFNQLAFDPLFERKLIAQDGEKNIEIRELARKSIVSRLKMQKSDPKNSTTRQSATLILSAIQGDGSHNKKEKFNHMLVEKCKEISLKKMFDDLISMEGHISDVI